MRTTLVAVLVCSFTGVGLVACTEGQWRIGIASVLLAIANGLLLLT